jgi:predicted XRE-type DNA-binding protein
VDKKFLKLLDEGWELGSSAFSDLGIDDAEGLQAKAYLRAAILAQIESLAITQREAARRVGVPQPKMSMLMSDADHQRGFSSDKLMQVATRLGLDITISVSQSRSETGRVTVAAVNKATRGRKKSFS